MPSAFTRTDTTRVAQLLAAAAVGWLFGRGGGGPAGGTASGEGSLPSERSAHEHSQAYGEMLIHPALLAGPPNGRVAVMGPHNSRAVCEIMRHRGTYSVDWASTSSFTNGAPRAPSTTTPPCLPLTGARVYRGPNTNTPATTTDAIHGWLQTLEGNAPYAAVVLDFGLHDTGLAGRVLTPDVLGLVGKLLGRDGQYLQTDGHRRATEEDEGANTYGPGMLVVALGSMPRFAPTGMHGRSTRASVSQGTARGVTSALDRADAKATEQQIKLIHRLQGLLAKGTGGGVNVYEGFVANEHAHAHAHDPTEPRLGAMASFAVVSVGPLSSDRFGATDSMIQMELFRRFRADELRNLVWYDSGAHLHAQTPSKAWETAQCTQDPDYPPCHVRTKRPLDATPTSERWTEEMLEDDDPEASLLEVRNSGQLQVRVPSRSLPPP